MGKLPHAGNFRDLIVYQKARALAREIFEISRTFPKEEMYSFSLREPDLEYYIFE